MSNQYEECARCNGEGIIHPPYDGWDYELCPDCGGSGEWWPGDEDDEMEPRRVCPHALCRSDNLRVVNVTGYNDLVCGDCGQTVESDVDGQLAYEKGGE